MEKIATDLLEVIKDYRNDDGIFLTVEDILKWTLQFDDDSMFMLQEISHIMPQV